ncbi:MAG: Gfo/Idh/MocA family protein [Pararhizobium sp.]
MFRWGILSTAKIAREHVIPQMLEAENGVVAAIASRDKARGEAVAAPFGIPRVFGSYDEMLASDAIDGVYIPLPTSEHIAWSIRAAKAGKHVLCEKPIALSADAIAPLIEARDENGVIVAEAFMVFYHPQWAKVRALIAEGAIGTLRHVQGAFSYYNVDPSNMRNQVALGGGALPDIGVYPTVATRMVTGAEPSRVQATVERDPTFGTDRYASVRADFGTFELSFYCATQLAARQTMVFHGDAGFIEVDGPFNAGLYAHQTIRLHNRNHTEAATYRFPAARQYRLQAEAFARRAAGADEPIFTLEDSVRNQKVIDAIYRAGEKDGWEAV